MANVENVDLYICTRSSCMRSGEYDLRFAGDESEEIARIESEVVADSCR